ncbi:exported protein of unknown function [Blastococcus saxobsidens DD2]|uniref:Thioesterase domain-containing protein n=1 Tax=Blastococcus saxobsidens (strain DD2) TaxID=1146883 RepID=H6RS66_BLASD|nr:exported protein of unknown function [Blastococcus saxobsidens DD2]
MLVRPRPTRLLAVGLSGVGLAGLLVVGRGLAGLTGRPVGRGAVRSGVAHEGSCAVAGSRASSPILSHPVGRRTREAPDPVAGRQRSTATAPPVPGTPGRLEVSARLRTRGEHLTVCEADVAQDGKSLVHAVATFALLTR